MTTQNTSVLKSRGHRNLLQIGNRFLICKTFSANSRLGLMYAAGLLSQLTSPVLLDGGGGFGIIAIVSEECLDITGL